MHTVKKRAGEPITLHPGEIAAIVLGTVAFVMCVVWYIQRKKSGGGGW